MSKYIVPEVTEMIEYDDYNVDEDGVYSIYLHIVTIAFLLFYWGLLLVGLVA